MITLVLLICDAFGTNPRFKPTDLYLGTIFLDLVSLIVGLSIIYAN